MTIIFASVPLARIQLCSHTNWQERMGHDNELQGYEKKSDLGRSSQPVSTMTILFKYLFSMKPSLITLYRIATTLQLHSIFPSRFIFFSFCSTYCSARINVFHFLILFIVWNVSSMRARIVTYIHRHIIGN